MELERTNFPGRIQGDEWDYYPLNGKKVCIATDREVAFGRTIGTIPLKGYVLAALTAYFSSTEHPHPRIIIAQNTPKLPVSIIMQRYLSGDLWQQYQKGIRNICEYVLPQALKENQQLESSLFIPMMNNHILAKQAIYAEGLVDEDVFEKVEETAAMLFKQGTENAEKHKLILVSATYEFDVEGNVIPGFHLPTTAVYWEQGVQVHPKIINQWLGNLGFKGDGPAPPIPDEIKKQASEEYIQLYKKLTGKDLKVPKKEKDVVEFLKQ